MPFLRRCGCGRPPQHARVRRVFAKRFLRPRSSPFARGRATGSWPCSSCPMKRAAVLLALPLPSSGVP